MARSIGIIECDCLSDVVGAADRMIKAADVRLVRQVQIGNSKLALVAEGDTAEIERALTAAKEGASASLTTELVSNVRPQVLNIFDLPGGGVFGINRS
jgi:microcompartment protein CcmL/EutN